MPQISTESQVPRHGFFITGTDTDVGKTFVAANIARHWVNTGTQVIVRKPIASGCIRQADGSLYSEDAHHLKAGACSAEPIDTICPHQFEPAVSPHLALQQAGCELSITQLLSCCQLPLTKRQCLIVEGAGGWMSPLASDGLNQDFARRLQLPVILVVANRLGCINHALLSALAIQAAGLRLHAVIVNSLSPGNENFTQGLSQWLKVPIYHHPFCESQSIQPFQIDD